MSEQGKAYKDYVAERVLLSRAHRMSALPLRLTMGVHPHNNGKYDISNRVKPLEDALVAAGVMVDDTQVVDLQVVKLSVIKGSRLILMIEELPGWNADHQTRSFLQRLGEKKPRAPEETRGSGLVKVRPRAS